MSQAEAIVWERVTVLMTDPLGVGEDKQEVMELSADQTEFEVPETAFGYRLSGRQGATRVGTGMQLILRHVFEPELYLKANPGESERWPQLASGKFVVGITLKGERRAVPRELPVQLLPGGGKGLVVDLLEWNQVENLPEKSLEDDRGREFLGILREHLKVGDSLEELSFEGLTCLPGLVFDEASGAYLATIILHDEKLGMGTREARPLVARPGSPVRVERVYGDHVRFFEEGEEPDLLIDLLASACGLIAREKTASPEEKVRMEKIYGMAAQKWGSLYDRGVAIAAPPAKALPLPASLWGLSKEI